MTSYHHANIKFNQCLNDHSMTSYNRSNIEFNQCLTDHSMTSYHHSNIEFNQCLNDHSMISFWAMLKPIIAQFLPFRGESGRWSTM